MTTHLKPLEELVRELPPDAQAEVRNFVESLLAKNTPTASPTGTSNCDGQSFEQFFGTWDSGDENSADNERIDADLAREYEAPHESEG